MPNFKEPTTPEEQSEQLSAPEQNDALEQDKQGPEDELSPESLQKKFDQQDAQSDEVIGQADELLDHIDGIDDEEPEVTERLNGVINKISEAIRKSNALKIAITAGAFFMTTAAHAGTTLDAVNEAVAQQTQEYNKQHTTHNTASEYINAQKVRRNRMIIARNGRLKSEADRHTPNSSINSIFEAIKKDTRSRDQILQDSLKGAKFGTSKLKRLHRLEKYTTVNSLGNMQQGMLRKNRERLNNIHIGGIYGNDQPSHLKFQSYNNVDSNSISADPTSSVGIGGINVDNNR